MVEAERKPSGRFKILGVLAAANDYIFLLDVASLAGYSEVYSKLVLDKFWCSGYIEKVARGRNGNLWRITERGRQEYRKLANMFGVVPVEKQATPIVRSETQRKYLSRQKRKDQIAMGVKTSAETKLEESFRADRDLRANERGLRKFFLYDLNNPIDQEIVRQICERRAEYQEQLCRQLLAKRLSITYCTRDRGSHTDPLIENRLLKRCARRGITRNELVRQLLCIQLNIKEGYEICRDLIKTDSYTAAVLADQLVRD